MKILLVKPHAAGMGKKGLSPPLGLGYIASSLLQDGHKVEIIDLTLYKGSEYKTLIKRTKEFSPDIVGITCNSNERFPAFNIARWVKKENGQIKVVMGGSYVTLLAEETLKDISYCDIVVRGEGELTMKELCNQIEKNNSIENIKGISYKDKEGHIHTTLDRPFITDLDVFPSPARHLMEMEKYNFSLDLPGEKPNIATMISSRGCPFNCNFCSATILVGNKVRFRSVENVVDEMEDVLSKYSFLDGLAIMDDCFLINEKRVIGICDEIKKRNLDFEWYCWGRTDNISRELVRTIKTVGCKAIGLGVESGSSKVLKAMNKRTNFKKNLNAIKIIKSEGLIAHSSFIFNYPGEGLIDILKTYLLWVRSGLEPWEITTASYPIAYPGTNLFEMLKKRRYIPEDFCWGKHFNIPTYNDVPVYIPPFNFFRRRLRRYFLIAYKILSRLKKKIIF
jgi:anaerobic magnesium-protoporphyrin IX monomethyl ester cyclase